MIDRSTNGSPIEFAGDRQGVPGTLFFLSTLGQRLGIWISGFPFPIVLLMAPLVIVAGVVRNKLRFSIARGTCFLALLIVVAISFVFAQSEWSSAQSALLFVAMYAPWAFFAPVSDANYKKYVGRVALWTSVMGVLAAVQFFGQYAIKSELWFSWRSIIPAMFLIEYNTLNEVSYGSAVYKGNGFFLLEPSVLSGIIARVFLLTVLVLQDVRFAIPFSIGLLFALSGTGVVFTLIFTVPILLLRLAQRFSVGATSAFVAVALLVVAALWFGTFIGDYASGRLGEFTDPRSSGYARFTGTLNVFEQYLTNDLKNFLIGYGPGTFKQVTQAISSSEEVFGSGWIKLFIEYGLLGLSAFTVFFLYCVYSSTRSLLLSVALLFQYLILDGAVLVPQLVFVCYAIFVLPVTVGARRDAPTNDHPT
ncbi:MAG: hypothetical protein K2X41_04240 [Hyphomicrobium sp.]|nr:hypothetical protein [Hyphomicrobium sp.]